MIHLRQTIRTGPQMKRQQTEKEKTGDGEDTAAVQTGVANRSIHQIHYYVHVRTVVLFTLNSHIRII